jgi:hypothetical protein
MEKVLWTPRLKLTLLETLEDDSKDLEWAHQMRTDEQATSWRSVFLSKLLCMYCQVVTADIRKFIWCGEDVGGYEEVHVQFLTYGK